jgi:hypothetical protein
MRKLFIFAVAIIMSVLACLPTAEINGATSKAVKAYKQFLKQNVSVFYVDEGDFYTFNHESYKKSSGYIIVDMDKNGTPELVTYHPRGYNQGYLCLYTYKNGKVISVKKANGKKAKISENCTAAGWYDTYACSKKHLHVKWEGGSQGTTETVYTLKNGRLNKYLSSNVDDLKGTSAYKKNGRKISAGKYKALTKKCKRSAGMKKNK